MNLINKDVLMQHLTLLETADPNFTMTDVKILVRELPIVEERKHGYWVDETPVDGAEEVLSKWRCSICNCEAGTLKGEYPTWKACPNCTAIMDEVEG